MLQLPLFEPTSTWTAPDLSALPSWAGARRVAIDTETYDPQLRALGPGVRRGAYIIGYSFAIEDGPSFYIPMRHAGGGNVDAAQALAYLRQQCGTFTGEILGANLSYDLDFLAEEDIAFPNVERFRDVLLAEALINELHDSYSLTNVAKRRGLPNKEEELLREAASVYGIDPKKDMYQLPARFVGSYGEQDAALPLLLYYYQKSDIEEQELWNVHNLESDVLRVLVKMRRLGVRIDLDHLDRIDAWTRAEEQKALAVIADKTGVKLALNDITNTSNFGKALTYIGVEFMTKKGKPVGITDEWLAGINHPVVDAIRRAKKVNKVRGTFVASLRRYMIVNTLTGQARVHCSYNQLRATDEGDGSEKGAAFGRLSSQDPNLQQQPARDPEIGPFWRKVYIPDDGGRWCAADYSQQEPRMAVHFGAITPIKPQKICGEWVDVESAARNARDAYRNDPKCDNHQMMADMAHISRKSAKEIFLGLAYGMGGAKLCRKLGMPTRYMFRYTPADAKNKWEQSENFYGEDEHELESRLREKRQKEPRCELSSIFEVAGAEGQELLDKFSLKVPFIPVMAKLCQKRAKEKGYIKTLSGRRCRFPVAADGGFDWVHKAFNRLIQGSSADQTKTAMVALDNAGFAIQLQVHDEFDLTVYDDLEPKKIAEIMENCVALSLPSKVDIELGPSWGEAK